jgi:hypothetical protein
MGPSLYPGRLSHDEEPEESGVYLHFNATLSQPDFARFFLEYGGTLDTAAVPGPIDVSISGSRFSTTLNLDPTHPFCAKVEIPKSAILESIEGTHTRVVLSNLCKLNACCLREGVAINGTLVDTHAGSSSGYLSDVLTKAGQGGLLQLPFKYGSANSHVAVMAMANAQVRDKRDRPVEVEFVEDKCMQEKMKAGVNIMEKYSANAWDLREPKRKEKREKSIPCPKEKREKSIPCPKEKREKSIPYPLAKGLTKSVAHQPTGIGDYGWDFVHNVVDQQFPFADDSLNSLLEQSIRQDLGCDDELITEFLSDTKKPGLKAAQHMKTAANALSGMASYLMSYKADGRSRMTEKGATNEVSESWLRRTMRTPAEANDCDGSALLITSALNTALHLNPSALANHEYINAVKNCCCPYYTPAVSVVSATAAEASSGGGSTIAGHAVAVVIPTKALIEAMHKPSNTSQEVRNMRLGAVFNEQVLKTLPEEEREALLAGGSSTVATKISSLTPRAMEGTTWASSTLYVPNDMQRTRAEHHARLDERALAAVDPHVARATRTLHVGGTDGHKFYKHFVEISISPKHPLFTNTELRKTGNAATQFVLTNVSATEAGASPKDLVLNNYSAVPMGTFNFEEASIIDEVSAVASDNVVAPRRGPMVLTADQSTQLKQSEAYLAEMKAKLMEPEEHTSQETHPVSYTLPFSTLVNNSDAVKCFCERVCETAAFAIVDIGQVVGLAVHPGELSKSAGLHVVVTPSIPV